MRWETLRSEEFDAALVPTGAIEQHGRHLPVDVDIHCATEVCDAVAARVEHVIVAPPVPWGYSRAQTYKRGTITLGAETLLNLLRDVCDSIFACGFTRVLMVNGHNGNKWMAGQIVADLRRPPGSFLGSLTYFDLTIDTFQEHRRSRLGGEGHAGELETSLELFLRPELVTAERDVRYVEPLTDLGFVDLAVRGPLAHTMRQTFPEGVMGDPDAASAELGEHLFEAAVAGIAQIVADVRADDARHEGAT
jgi:creatinine amidohydrolase